MPVTEVYLAIQQGVVQGQDNPIDTIYSNKFYEVAPYITITNHLYSPLSLAMAEKTWQKLSPEDQKAVMKAAKDATDFSRNFVKETDEKMLADMVARGPRLIGRRISQHSARRSRPCTPRPVTNTARSMSTWFSLRRRQYARPCHPRNRPSVANLEALRKDRL